MLFTRLLIACLTLTALAVPMRAQPAGAEKPDLLSIIDPGQEDLGLIAVGAMAGRTVRFKNVSGTPIGLEIVRKSCGCVQTSFSKPALAPGEDGTLAFGTTVLLSSLVEHHFVVMRATVRDQSGLAERHEDFSFAIQYSPNVECQAMPKIIVRHGIAGEPILFETHLLKPDKQDFDVDEITRPWPWLSVKSIVKDGVLPGRAAVTFAGVLPPAGRYSGSADIRLKGSSGPAATLDITLISEEPFYADPPGVIVTYDHDTGALTRTVSLHRRPQSSTQALPASLSLEDGLKWFSAELERPQDKNAAHVTVRIDTARLQSVESGAARSTILIRDAAGKPLCSLPVVAMSNDWLRPWHAPQSASGAEENLYHRP